jgi:hypothetical protein
VSDAVVPVHASRFFEFIAGEGLKVILVSVHPLHTFNAALAQRLRADHADIALGTVGLTDLVVSGGSAVPFLHQGLRGCGAPAAFGVLPGYCLFRDAKMLAWDAGFPASTDVEGIARGALLGVIWSGLTRDLSFVTQALRGATEQVAAQRVAARFMYAAAHAQAYEQAWRQTGDPASSRTPPRGQDLYWAYQTLGVLPTASDREVHDAWRRKRMEHHPDHAGSDAADFERRSRLSAEINRARDIILEHRAGGARRSPFVAAS